MKRRPFFFILLASVLLLSGCVSRSDADEQLAKGCKAGAELFLENGFEIKDVKKSTFKTSPEFGNAFREVMLFVKESDGWLEKDEEYKCTFVEEFGFLGSSYDAEIYQIQIHDQTYGRDGNSILGDMETHARLTQAVQNAMHE